MLSFVDYVFPRTETVERFLSQHNAELVSMRILVKIAVLLNCRGNLPSEADIVEQEMIMIVVDVMLKLPIPWDRWVLLFESRLYRGNEDSHCGVFCRTQIQHDVV